MASVIIRYDKKISKNNLKYQQRTNLLSYKYIENTTKLCSKRLVVYIIPLTIRLMMKGEYNYYLFNLESYGSLHISQLRLLYYYFCLYTIPGGPPVIHRLEKLLSLWLESSNKYTIKKRKHLLIHLLEELEKSNDLMKDLHFSFIKNKGRISAVSVKKMKLKVQ